MATIATITYNGTSVEVTSDDECATIAEAFDLYREILGLPVSGITPTRNGDPVDLDDEIYEGDELSAARPDGNKGQ